MWSGASLRAYLWKQTSTPTVCAARGGTVRPSTLLLSSPWRTRPARLHARTRAVATTGVRSAARPAQMMGDWCRQVSWLTAHAHRLRLPAGCPAVALGATLAAYSCGGSRGMEEENPRTAFPFHPPRPNRSHGRTVTHPHRSKAAAELSTAAWPQPTVCACSLTSRQRSAGVRRQRFGAGHALPQSTTHRARAARRRILDNFVRALICVVALPTPSFPYDTPRRPQAPQRIET